MAQGRRTGYHDGGGTFSPVASLERTSCVRSMFGRVWGATMDNVPNLKMWEIQSGETLAAHLKRLKRVRDDIEDDGAEVPRELVERIRAVETVLSRFV